MKIVKRVIFGKKPVEEAFDSGAVIERVFISSNIKDDAINRIKELANQNRCFVRVVKPEAFDVYLTKYNLARNANHQGVFAVRSEIEYFSIEDVLPQLYEKGEVPLFVILDGVTDVMNFGAIARSAYAMGAHSIVIPFTNTASINSMAIKASSGALNKISVCREFSLRRAVEFLNFNGIQVVGAALQDGILPAKVDFKVPTAIVLGSEETGISNEILQKCDVITQIPMSGNFDSLNVSASAAILLYEALMQRS